MLQDLSLDGQTSVLFASFHSERACWYVSAMYFYGGQYAINLVNMFNIKIRLVWYCGAMPTILTATLLWQRVPEIKLTGVGGFLQNLLKVVLFPRPIINRL